MKTKSNPCVVFGAFLKSIRQRNGITAREAATACEMLPSNFSKMEHGALRPPQDGDKHKKIAAAIHIIDGTPEAHTFFDLAAKAIDATPADVADIISEQEAMPLLIRTIQEKRFKDSEIKNLTNLVRCIDERI